MHKPPPSPRYKRQGLTLDAAPPSLESLREDRQEDGRNLCVRSKAKQAVDEQGGAGPEVPRCSCSGSGFPGRRPDRRSLPSFVSGGAPGGAKAKEPAAPRSASAKGDEPAPASANVPKPGNEPMLVDTDDAAVSVSQAAAAVPEHSVVSISGDTVKPSNLKQNFSRLRKSGGSERSTTVSVSDDDEPEVTVVNATDARYPGLPALLPPGSARQVTIGAEEMDRLQPGKWLCTKLVDFYCNYLWESGNVDVCGVLCAQPGLFEKLHRLARGSCLMTGEKFADEIGKTLKNYALRDLFKAQTVFIPIHFRILPMACATQSQPSESVPRRFEPETFPSYFPQVPLQPNSCDCALFTPHNLELLLKDTSLVEKVLLGAWPAG